MYTFIDPGGNQVSLRPEYTASIVRHYLDAGIADQLPVRVQYSGPVFRYEGDGNTYRQFSQMGAELLGSSSPRADAEILSLSYIALSGLGLSGHILQIGDLGVLHRLLEALGLSERATVFILGSLADLKDGQEGLIRVQERAKQLRLLSPTLNKTTSPPLSETCERPRHGSYCKGFCNGPRSAPWDKGSPRRWLTGCFASSE